MPKLKVSELKKLLKAKASLGSWLHFASPAVAEVVAGSGFDWVVLDLEHGFFNIETTVNVIRAIENRGSIPITRVAALDPVQIKLCLDAGVAGIICPMINTRADAERLVQSVFYPPIGSRGVGLSRAQDYGARFSDYVTSHSEETITIAQIEHIEGIKNLEEIITVEGIDAYIIGPYDLSASLGVPGELSHPKVTAAIEHFEKILKSNGKTLGFHIVQPDPVFCLEKIQAGYKFIAYGIDFLFLSGAVRESLKQLKNIRSASK